MRTRLSNQRSVRRPWTAAFRLFPDGQSIWRSTPPKKRLGGRFGCALGFEIRLQPGDLLAQNLDAFRQFAGRKERQVLADLVRFGLLAGLVVENRHGAAP